MQKLSEKKPTRSLHMTQTRLNGRFAKAAPGPVVSPLQYGPIGTTAKSSECPASITTIKPWLRVASDALSKPRATWRSTIWDVLKALILGALLLSAVTCLVVRSEERRVGKECRS